MFFPFSKKLIPGIFILVFLCKLAETELLTRLEYCQSKYAAGSRWANITGDSFSYIGAMENYITTGNYYFLNDKGNVIRAGRLPHYAVPYFLLRLFFSPYTSLDLFVLFQIAIEALAIIYLALLAFNLTKRKWCFYACLIFSVISVYITVWSYNTYTDAISTNLMVIACYYYYSYRHSRSNLDFLIFSIILGIITCLRPYIIVIYPFVIIPILLSKKYSFGYLFKKSLLLALPLIFLLAPWVIRNFMVMNRFILFQQDMYAGYGFTTEELSIRKVLTSMGEDGGSWWNRKSAASYFSRRSASTSLYYYPAYIKKDTGTFNQLELYRRLCLDTNRKSALVQKLGTEIIEDYRSKYPVRYYLTNHLQLIGKFVFNNGSYHLPVDKTSNCYMPIQYVYKLFQSFLFFLCLFFGSAGLVLMYLNDRQNFIFLLPGLYLILLFPLMFGLTEWRYFLPFYHFSQLGFIYLLWRFVRRFKWAD